MPSTSPVWVSGASFRARAMPKSVSLAYPSAVDDDVGRLDVAVDHPGVVRGLEGQGRLVEDLGDLGLGHGRALADQRRQRLALAGAP